MAVSLTTLKARIANELRRDDLTSEIASAITSAIALYQSKRFEFNEKQAIFNTVASQQSYTSGDTGFPTDIAQIDKVRVTVSGRYVYPSPKTLSELNAITSSTSDTGPPDVWAWYAAKLFFYPIPDAVYSVQLSYLQRKSAPASDADDTTIWTNQCGDLIRHCAKRLVARDYMRDQTREVSFARGEQEALAALLGESAQLQEGGNLAPSW